MRGWGRGEREKGEGLGRRGQGRRGAMGRGGVGNRERGKRSADDDLEARSTECLTATMTLIAREFCQGRFFLLSFVLCLRRYRSGR